MKNAARSASNFISRHGRLWNTILFLVLLFASFSFRTYHYNTSVEQLNGLVGDVPPHERVHHSFFRRFLPYRHNNFSPFTIESAMMFSYAQDIAEGKGVPKRDETLKHMEDIPPYAQMNMALEWFLGWGWRLKQKIAPDPEASPRERLYQDHPYMAQWMSAQIRLWASLTSALVFLWLLLLKCPRKLAFCGGFLHAVALSAIARSTGQDLVRGEFCIPLITLAFVLAEWCSVRARWWKAPMVFAVVFLAFVAWDLCQMIFSCWALIEVLRMILGFRMRRGAMYAWIAIAAAILLNALVVPFNITYGLIHAPILWVALPTLFCCYVLQGVSRRLNLSGGRRLALRLAVPLLAAALYLNWAQFGNTPEYASNYSHFSEAMKAKIQFNNVKPANALLLNYDARIMWTPSMHSATWEIASSFFPSLIFGRMLRFGLFRFLFGLLPVTLALYAVLLLGLTLFRIPREEFMKTLSRTFLPNIFTVGFIVGFIYIVRYHEFVILFLCVSLPMLVCSYLRAFRHAPWKVDPNEACTVVFERPRLLKVMRGTLIGLLSFILFWETIVSVGTPRRYTGDVPLKETAMLILWFRQHKDAVAGKGVAANFTVGPMLKAYAGTGLVMNPQFGMKRIRDATEKYLMAMYNGAEEDLYNYCTEYGVDYVVFNNSPLIFQTMHPYSNRYVAGANTIRNYSAVQRMHYDPGSLVCFRKLDPPKEFREIDSAYAVFKVIHPKDREEADHLAALGRSAFELENDRKVAAEYAEKAVGLAPTHNAVELYRITHGCKPRLTLSGVEDDR